MTQTVRFLLSIALVYASLRCIMGAGVAEYLDESLFVQWGWLAAGGALLVLNSCISRVPSQKKQRAKLSHKIEPKSANTNPNPAPSGPPPVVQARPTRKESP